MELQDRCVILCFSRFSVLYASRYYDIIAVTRIITNLANSFFCRYFTCYQFNVRNGRYFRAISAICVRYLDCETGTVDDMCVAPIFRVVVRAPTWLVDFSILPVVVPR